MVGIIIVTHLDYGEKLLQTAEAIVGKQEKCIAVSVDVSKSMEEILGDIQLAVKDLDEGEGVLILTDMFGGTPSNLSFSLLNSYNLEVVTGANLPMLLKILTNRNYSLQELASMAKSAGKQGIRVAGEVLNRRVAVHHGE